MYPPRPRNLCGASTVAGLLLALAACGGSSVAPPALTLALTGTASSQPNPCEIDVAFDATAVGQKATATLQLTNPGKVPLDLSAPDSAIDPVFTADFKGLGAPLSPGGTAKVALTYAPIAIKASASSFTIGLVPAAGTCSAITVSLSGSGVIFKLAVDPDSLDLGSVVVESTTSQSVSLINETAAVVTGLTATVGGSNPGDFSVSGMPDWLDAGAAADVSVTFKPRSAVPISHGSITFAGAAGETAKLAVSGEPLASPLTLTPNPLDLGYVLPVGVGVACTVAANISGSPVTITGTRSFIDDSGAFALSPTDDSTPPNPAPIPVTIPAGGSAKLCFTLTPQQLSNNQYTGQLTFVTDGPDQTYPVLQLTGWGGGPQVSCSTPTLSFGQTLDGTTSMLTVVCTNIGTAGQLPNLTLKPSTTSSVFKAAFDPTIDPYTPGVGLAPNQSAQIDVSYSPTGSGADQGILTIASNGGQGRGVQIALTGDALSLAACQFVIVPPSLDFGNLFPNRGGDAGALQSAFVVENTGTDSCLVKDLAVQNDANGSFHIVSTSIQPDPQTGWITIPAQSGLAGGFHVDLAYTPHDAGAATAEAAFWISQPGDLNQSVPLRGTSGSPCLIFVPPAIDFGVVGESDAGALCTSATRAITVFNQCTPIASLETAVLQSTSGDTVAQFTERSGPTLPQAIDTAPVNLVFEFEPTHLGVHGAELVLSEGPVDTFVPVTGTAVGPATATLQTDSFVAGPPKADILFVRDVGDDAKSEPLVAAQIADFLDAGAGIDYRLTVTTDDDDPTYVDADYGRLLPCSNCYAKAPGPLIVSPSSTPDGGSVPDPVGVFVGLLGAGGGGNRNLSGTADKHFRTALFDALTRDPQPGLDFFRPGAFFAVVNESDDVVPDYSYFVRPAGWYQSFFGAWFADSAMFTWNYILPGSMTTGTGLAKPGDLPGDLQTLIASTNGVALNLLDPAWPQAFLTVWAPAVSANLRYHLSTVPSAGAAGLAVSLNGSAVSASIWTFNGTANAVIFKAGSAPQPGDTIQVSYPIGCP